MSSADYATMYNYALVNAGKSKRFTDEEIQKFRDGSDPYNYPNTDWYDLAFRTGFLQKHNVSVNGGATYAKYLVSAGYLSEKGILRDSDDYLDEGSEGDGICHIEILCFHRTVYSNA